MAIFPIRVFPDPVLAMQASDVTEFDESLSRLIDDMLETMYEAPGVGLAAPQIGVLKRVFVADVGEGALVMVNPSVTDVQGSWKFEEGCLSVPDRYWQITRAEYARAEGVGRDGERIVFEGDDLMGRVLQHEIDHLDGTLLISRLSARVRRQVLKDLREESVATDGVL